jgi:hypothetical protein
VDTLLPVRLEIALELNTVGARFVGKARQVVAIDRARDAALVEDVAAEGGDLKVL